MKQRTKRIISMLLVFCMVMSMLPLQVLAEDLGKQPQAAQEAVNPFSDVSKTDWYYDSVMYAYQNNLFSGTSESTFSPNGTMTRGMFVTVMGRMAEIDLNAYSKAPEFTDVAAGSYYAPYVQWAIEKGITFGIGGGLFDPDGFVTRQQMAALIVRFFNAYKIPYPNTINTTTPKDIDLVDDWAKDAVLKLWSCGLLVGDDNGNFNPKSTAKRSEAAMLAFRTDQIVEQWFIDTGVKPAPGKEKEKKPDPGTGKTSNKGESGDSGNSGGGSGSKIYSVTFQDGERYIDRLSAAEGKALGAVPAAGKTAKENAIFVGWFTDKALTTPFYQDNPVTQNMTVYAKYADMPGETLTLTSFAQLDQDTDLSFEVVKTDAATASPDDAFTLIPKDGSDLIPLKWTTNGDVYTITAEGGYNKGSSYELNLADGYNFKDKPDSIRTASFTIKMEKVDNLQMNDDIVYIKDTAAIDYTIAGETYEVLTPSLVPENGGKFDYANAGNLHINDILCFYITTSPENRDYINKSYNDDPEVYAKVESISGTTVTFGALDEDDRQALYKVPDNFPIIVSQLPTEETGTVNIDALDIDTYALIMGADGTLDKAKESVNVGDFISLYVSSDSVTGEDAVYFGEVTGYDKLNGTITYKKTTAQAIENSMDLYISPEVDGDDLITAEEKAAIESQLLAQVQASNFANDAAFMLADMATKTNGFRNIDSVQSVFFKDENGKLLSEEEIALLNLGGSFELTDDVKLTVELITNGDQLHFKNGVQLAIGIDATFEVETVDGGKIVIDLSAVFVEEVALGINVKGDLVWKKVLGFIPIPIGVTVSAAVDIKNFTAVSFNVSIYTVEKEDEPFWERLKGLLADTKVGNILDQIEEVQNKIDQAKGTAEQIKGYAKDLEALWKAMPQDGVSKEEWAQLGKTLGKTSITKDLMDMMNLTTETSLEAGTYAKSMQDLMEKYSEMLQKETDWVKLVDKEMFGREICYYGVAIKANVNFVVRTDINIAMGTSLEYEVGKRYTFWFKIGLFKPKAGSETMDLIDERFAFQFYVMGKLGLKMGVAATIEVGIGSTEFASIGITAELGPYVKLYGFFIYEYEKMRPANTGNWIYKERMAGALYLEFGLYFILTFDAHAIGNLFEYSHDFFNIEVPLLKAGEKRYKYAFAYKPQEGEQVRIADEDSNSTNGITMKLPDSLRALSYVDLNTGILGSEPYDYEKYNITFSNPNFSIDKNGKVSVNVPQGVQYMECDATLTWLYGKLAFSKYDMTVTIPLVWTNLSTAELNEYFTASVRVGNAKDGYQTIWSQRVRKNQEFDLPTAEAIKKLIKYADYDDGSGNNMKYASISDYGIQDMKNLKIYDDTVYDIEATYKDYSVTVKGIEQADGTKINKTYTAKYSQAFNFKDLAKTGTNKPSDMPENAVFTKFAALTAEKAQGDIGNGELPTYDLTAPIEGKYALALTANKVNPTASYVDDSVLATFQFDGIAHADVIQKLKKGTEPNLAAIEEIVSAQGLAIKDISPAFGKLFTNTIYNVICENLTGSDVTIYFDENGGNEVLDITKMEGSLIGTLPSPNRKGYSFDGWYSDKDLTTAFAETKMPSESITLYAKWTANTYTVTLDAKGGTFSGDVSKKNIDVTYGSPYGELEAPTYSSKYFAGWLFDEDKEDTAVKSYTTVETASDHTLFANWSDLQTVSEAVYSFTPVTTIYEKGTVVSAVYQSSPEYAGIGGFTFEYRKQGDPNTVITAPVDAGTYDVVVRREKDSTYAKFEHRYLGVVIINKATRTLDSVPLEVNKQGYIFLDLKPAENAIDDLSNKAKFTFNAVKTVGGLLLPGESSSSSPGESYIGGLLPATDYYITVKVTDDPNYEDAASSRGVDISTLAAPTSSWSDNTESFTVTDNKATITTAGQLAYLAQQVNSGANYVGVTITLANDIDLTGHKWIPIGNNQQNSFQGTFDGGKHTISGLYAKGGDSSGLFGFAVNATIKNVRLEESYVEGNDFVGGIAGYFVAVTLGQTSLLQNCVNSATVVGNGAYIGGIAGYIGSVFGSTKFDSCVNYGRIIGNDKTGGIAGYQSTGWITNSTNFGSVVGTSSVGGVIGQNENKNSHVLNCYTTGTVKGDGKYVGAVVGRNTKDDGKILQCYYRLGSATCNGAIRNATGTEKGSLADGEKGTQTASFASQGSTLSRDCGFGTENLMSALRKWVNANTQYGSSNWVVGTDGYPIPQGLPQK
ncbi:InlB B-repeat-containing protein [Lutispora sp.]|uniref:InlB B-repeat-containing protein n=1 Tax=Lutispora sp. TaxID=2828727 RepID=UPI002B1F000C|nr:InlB B-repeat-containing protein [Lutispora sp.]MEA4961123.1 S-layer homology domain-containing protein [Lutispora sp.]